MTAILEARNLVRHFIGGDGRPVEVLSGASLALEAGECVAIVGASGTGKSTLLHLLGALDRPDAGEVLLEGRTYAEFDVEALEAVRNRRVGFVFQFHHLLRDFNALENVMMPLLIAGASDATARERAAKELERVGLTARALSRVTVLSGGEQQRVALARALVTHPAVLLADEPTGNLDAPTASRMHELLLAVARSAGAAVVVVTHNPALAALTDRILTLENGVLRSAEPS